MYLQTDRHRSAITPLTDERLVSKAAALIGVSAWSCDLDTSALSWTDGVFDIFGLGKDMHLDRQDTVDLYCEESRETMLRLRAKAIETQSGFSMEAQIRQPSGELRWMRLTAMTHVENGKVVQLYGVKQDITQERLQWEQLRRLAESDPLTGLANRARFHAEFLDLPQGSEQLSRIGALAMFDLNEFKAINDRWGHAAGDACIARFGQRLAGVFPKAHLIARIGGDEFAMLLPATMPAAEMEFTVRRRLKNLIARVEWQGTLIPVGFSAGLAFSCGSPEATFAAADAALYAAKRSGRNVMRVAA